MDHVNIFGEENGDKMDVSNSRLNSDMVMGRPHVKKSRPCSVKGPYSLVSVST